VNIKNDLAAGTLHTVFRKWLESTRKNIARLDEEIRTLESGDSNSGGKSRKKNRSSSRSRRRKGTLANQALDLYREGKIEELDKLLGRS
jgi:hypothetical protein